MHIKSSLLHKIPESPVAISTYTPTLDADLESKETFYASLNSGTDKTSPTDKLILLEDFNARVGSDSGL